MVERPVSVLLIEDDDDDYLLTKELFAEFSDGAYHLDRVADYLSALRAIDECDHDIYLVDFRLGEHTGLDFVAEAVRLGCTKPMIMLTGQREREIDVLAMKAGAADYLVKDQLDAEILERAIRYALRQKSLEEEIRHANQRLEQRVHERTSELARVNDMLKSEIAERRRAETLLRDADHRKDEFLATLAHELRNPLAPITSALQLLEREPHDPQQVLQLREMMSRQVSQLKRLIDDLLDVSRISRGKLSLRRETVMLQDVISGAVAVAQPLIESAGHALAIAVPTLPLCVDGDQVRLAQVISNLLVNAAKYTPPGGRIELTGQIDNGQVAISVRDNGIGIPPSMLARIFELFAQVDGSATRSQGGLGIGLTLAKTLVEMHGGAISVNSEGAGRGSQFTVRLPISDEIALSSLPAATAPRGPLVRRRILIVDDNEPAALLLSRLLRKLGQEVQMTNSASVALAFISEWQPEVVISDIAMPNMSGFELAQSIRAQADIRQPVLIALTGYGQESDRQQAREAGFDHHLTKPVDIRSLETILAEIPGVSEP